MSNEYFRTLVAYFKLIKIAQIMQIEPKFMILSLSNIFEV